MRSNKPKKMKKFLLPLVFLAGICSFPAANLLMGQAKKAGFVEQKQPNKSSTKKLSLSKKPNKKQKKQYKSTHKSKKQLKKISKKTHSKHHKAH